MSAKRGNPPFNLKPSLHIVGRIVSMCFRPCPKEHITAPQVSIPKISCDRLLLSKTCITIWKNCVLITPIILTESLVHGSCLKVGSHDPIFASNYSSAHFFRQQLDVNANFWQVSSSFCVLDENRTCSIFIQLDQKNRLSLIFPRSILLNIFTKWPPQLGP